MSDPSTPTATISKKRFLSSPSSPEFIAQLKRVKNFDMAENESETRSLSANDIKLIAEAVRESLRDDLLGLRNEVAELKAENDTLRAKVEKLEQGMDASEQYSRRNNLRIAGLVESDSESTDTLVMDMASALGVQLTLSDIDRSHRVGKKTPKKPRDVIIRFTSYRQRAKFYKARTRAKDIPNYFDIFVNEDLTRTRNNLLYECRMLVKSKRLKSAWSSDGIILVKDVEDKVHRITSTIDLSSF